MVSSSHRIASDIGVRTLKKGGNAIDAAVAMSLALGVVTPPLSGIGGGGFALVYLRASGQTFMLDFRETAPGDSRPDMFHLVVDGRVEGDANRLGHVAVAVPGEIAGLSALVEEHGNMNFKNHLLSAAKIAERGCPVSKYVSRIMETEEAMLRINRFKEIGRIFLKNGKTRKEGALLIQNELAQSYKKIANDGIAAFYDGEIATRIVEEIARGRGTISRDDLRSYRPVTRSPVTGSYRDHEILSAYPPSAGGTQLIQILNILETYDIAAMGHNSSQAIHVMVEAMKLAFAGRDNTYGDPDFVEVRVSDLTSKKRASKLRNGISSAEASPDRNSGVESKLWSGTNHVAVIDEQRNAVSLTDSVDCWFASGIVVPGTGILLNDEMHDFNPRPGKKNSIASGKRPASSMTPTIILRDGEPMMAFGASGATKIVTSCVQTMVNMVDFGMTIQDSVGKPRFHCEGGQVDIENVQLGDTILGLKRMGHRVKVTEGYSLYFGGVHGVQSDPETYRLVGGADPRRDGRALGY